MVVGARAAIMRESMDAVRGYMRKLGDAAGWKPVELLQDYSIVSNGSPLPLAAVNERLKAVWLCRIVCAILSRSMMVVLDAADTLKGDHWRGMLDMLRVLSQDYPSMTVVVCATSEDEGEELAPEWMGAVYL